MSERSHTEPLPDPRALWHALRVARVVPETADARSLVLEIPDALRELFAYRAGQFLSFRVRLGEERLVRCYSLSSAPETDAEHKVTVKRVAGGRVSNWMNDVPRPGDTLEVMRPAGLFCATPGDSPMLLFSGGSGITPVISLVKSALATTRRSLKLVYANRDDGSIIFRRELDELVVRHPDRLEVIHRLDAVEGFVDAPAVRGYVGGSADADFYVCGPTPFMDTVESTLLELGAPRERIFIERFEYAANGAPAEAPASGAARAAAPESLVVTLDGVRRRVPYRAGDSVLQTARRAGMDPPFACEEGYCGSCMARVKAGAFEMRSNDVLTEAEVEEGLVLTCQAVPTSEDAEVEYLD
jgi:3-ketosteroid 9alpha-monooxygenase subunit B